MSTIILGRPSRHTDIRAVARIQQPWIDFWMDVLDYDDGDDDFEITVTAPGWPNQKWSARVGISLHQKFEAMVNALAPGYLDSVEEYTARLRRMDYRAAASMFFPDYGPFTADKEYRLDMLMMIMEKTMPKAVARMNVLEGAINTRHGEIDETVDAWMMSRLKRLRLYNVWANEQAEARGVGKLVGDTLYHWSHGAIFTLYRAFHEYPGRPEFALPDASYGRATMDELVGFFTAWPAVLNGPLPTLPRDRLRL